MTSDTHWYTDKGIRLSDNKVYSMITDEINDTIKQFYSTLTNKYQGIHVTPKELYGFYCSTYPTHSVPLTHVMRKLVQLGLPKSRVVCYKGKATRIYSIPKI